MQVTVNPGPVDPVASNASGYIVAGSFADGQEVSDSAARPQSANANIEVLRCKHLISATFRRHIRRNGRKTCIHLPLLFARTQSRIAGLLTSIRLCFGHQVQTLRTTSELHLAGGSDSA